MAFNTGLSGLRAASVDLDVTGNNIANASTVGFKGSKAQFGDLYASGFLGAGNSPVGDGVRVQDVKQSFSQGNVSFTDSGLDMAISGDGFFILNNGGETRYSRAGQFGIDKDGFVTNNQGMRVQGFTADDDGNLSGIRGDLQIDSDNLAPRRTTLLETDVNLDSRESVLENRNAFLIGRPGAAAPDEAQTNGILGASFSVTYRDGSNFEGQVPIDNSSPTGLSAEIGANDVADFFNGIDGFSASALTEQTISGADLQSILDEPDFSFQIDVGENGEAGSATIDSSSFNGSVPTLAEFAEFITSLPGVSGISASEDGGDLLIRQNSGFTLNTSYSGTDTDVSPNASISGGGEQVGFLTTLSADDSVEGLSAPSSPSSPAATSNLVARFNAGTADPVVTNQFNPLDQRTYNHATSTTIYDSLGNSHELTQFYVKDPSPGEGVGSSQWSIYAQIDGETVGGTNQNPFVATFNASGELESVRDPVGSISNSGEILITDWVPKDTNGIPNGADGPPQNPANVVTPIPEPPTSSAFVINLGGTTQYGASFGVNDQQQNGYTTGRLSGLDVSNTG
nr:flagellar hook-basal body complex protein [Marinobacter similis]